MRFNRREIRGLCGAAYLYTGDRAMTRLNTLDRKRAPVIVLSPPDKLAAAKKFLGARWLLHKDNHAKRLAVPFGERK